jgi:hypothetical protein
MTRYLNLAVLLMTALWACKPADEENMGKMSPTMMLNENPPLSQMGNAARKGVFVSNVHSTSGTATVFEKEGTRTLSIDSFRTDNGPDLYVYLSKDLKASDFVDLGRLKCTNGSFNYPLDSSVDVNQYRYVLIWCRRFSVLFGHVELK